MQSRIKAALTAPMFVAAAGLATPADATPGIHCAPAPLTERPAAAGEVNRPHVAPLEEAFLDAAIVKRTFATRASQRARP